MIDVSEIDLDSLTTLELWELHERVVARMGDYVDYNGEAHCPAEMSSYGSYAARDRMRSLV